MTDGADLAFYLVFNYFKIIHARVCNAVFVYTLSRIMGVDSGVGEGLSGCHDSQNTWEILLSLCPKNIIQKSTNLIVPENKV